MSEVRLIDANALKKTIGDLYGLPFEEMVEDFTWLKAIDNAPTVEERPHGEWIEIPVERDLLYNTGIKYTCSICGRGNCYGKPPFCMYCGADMRGKEE